MANDEEKLKKNIEELRDMIEEEKEDKDEVDEPVLTQKLFRLKLCCHRPNQTICRFVLLPFQPKNGDVIAVKPDGDEHGRLTFLVHDLIWDDEEQCFIMRPDIIDGLRKAIKQPTIMNEEVDPMGEF